MVDITPEVISSFRENYPLFSDLTTWPDDIVEQALCEADAETGSKNWGAYQDLCRNFKQRGMFLYAAHWLISTYPSGAESGSSQSPAPKNQVSSKSVGDESISFSTYSPSSINDAADSWLLTTSFGQQFIRLRRRAGRGCRAL